MHINTLRTYHIKYIKWLRIKYSLRVYIIIFSFLISRDNNDLFFYTLISSFFIVRAHTYFD